ncbi:MAG TPA: hypothetical protein DC042_07980 [Bacteroidales bacterium]|nr:hypothetical protein [Bacteroidales bacterium]
MNRTKKDRSIKFGSNSDNLTLSLLQATLDSTADGILAVDLAGMITGFNRRFIELWKIPEEVIESREDQSAIQFVLDQVEYPVNFTRKIRELYSDLEAISFDVIYLKDTRIFERYSRPQTLDGMPVGRVWSFRDVTDRSKAEQDLKEQKYLFDILLRTIPDNIYYKDKNSRFFRISEAMSRFFGLSNPSEAIGKTDFDFFSEEHAREAFRCEQEIIKTGIGIENLEEKETWPDGRVTWASSSKVPLINSNGISIGTFGVSRDITARKQSEIALQEANKTKDKFLGIIAHDLRNPIGTIMGLAEIALTELDGLKNDLLVKYLRNIYSSSYQTYILLENLLQWAGNQRHGGLFRPEQVELSSLISQVAEQQVYAASQKGIKINNKVSRPIFGKADINMLRTVIRNLLANAVKFTPQGGIIEIDCTDEADELRVSVSDSGIGMTADHVSRIMDPDSSFTATGTNGEHGSGLGLMLCKDFVRQNGGRIWVDSVLGKGSTFCFTIPFTSEHT